MNQNSLATANWLCRVSWHNLMIGGTKSVLPIQWSISVKDIRSE